jgi:hypothetical protein
VVYGVIQPGRPVKEEDRYWSGRPRYVEVLLVEELCGGKRQLLCDARVQVGHSVEGQEGNGLVKQPQLPR